MKRQESAVEACSAGRQIVRSAMERIRGRNAICRMLV
jgi:hypothetical protein